METLAEARDKIYKEIVSDDKDVRAKFLENYNDKAAEFSDAMARAVLAWREVDAQTAENEKLSYVSGLVFTALTLHIQSMKTFLSGQLVASGNLLRQTVESIALALLCSGKELGVLERFIEDKYSTNDAVRDVLRHSDKLNLLKEGVAALRDAQGFYHKYSHPSKATMASVMSFGEKELYVGSSFDKGKAEAYAKEVEGRLGLSRVMVNFVEAVKANLSKK
jgi:hypothetical protein